MVKLKPGPITDDRAVKLAVELPAVLFRDLAAYGQILGRASGTPSIEPAKLVVPMLERFVRTDRGFAKAKPGLGARDPS